MRQKRAKVYRKLMTMYQDSFGFRTPFQILCDASFCLEGARTGLLAVKNTAKLMDELVQGPCTLSESDIWLSSSLRTHVVLTGGARLQ